MMKRQDACAGVIINPRGAAGAGKSALARLILADYGRGETAEPMHRHGRARPIGYRLLHPLGGRPLAALGHYGAASCSGCDTIPLRDGGLDEVFRLADWLASGGHDVLLEGLFLSFEHQRSADLARRHALHVLWLDMPIEHCVRSLLKRRRVGSARRTTLAGTVVVQRHAVEQACARLRQSAASVERLELAPALERAREVLGLRHLTAAARTI